MQRAEAGRRWRLQRRLLRKGAREELLPQVGARVGDWVLEARLGAGVYGTVFRARRGERWFAVKFIFLPQVGALAWRELEVTLRLSRVGMLAVEGHGYWPPEEKYFLFIVTPLVAGLPLDEWAERTNLNARQVARLGVALGEQLGLAHAVGVVHRDLKPANVVVREEDELPVLVDFGMGTCPGSLEVTGGLLPCSARLRAPEAWRFGRERERDARYEASPRDDAWALGVLLYWLLTGTWPFEGTTDEEVEDAVLYTQPVPAHERNPRVPPALSAVCMRMLEQAREARYPDVDAVCEALEAALAGADTGWEVPLCDGWAPDNATTHREGPLDLERSLARDRRLVKYVREHPRRGPVPEAPKARAVVAEAVAPGPREEQAPGVATGRAVGGRALAWGVMGLLAAVHVHAGPVPPWEEAMSGGEAAPMRAATRTRLADWLASGQEVAPLCGAPEGDGGAVPSWATTSAPVARATLPEDTPVKIARQDSGSPQQPSHKQGQGRNAVATALCTAAAGAVAAGCPGAQVRDTPAPEACPAGSVETMQRLGIRIGDEAGSNFPGAEPGYFVVREAPSVRLILGQPLGQLSPGTVLTGRFLFGKERVYGRFTEALTAGGDTWSVCLEAWDIGEGVLVRGLLREPDEGGPGTATVIASPHLKAVERFE
ncbi:serine/threonine-protein kinase [Archangium sp.]|uniref:serine/threonine protein kinase n=1 Tax=Archangium sp. TaxID=1872627 RepID=UPI00286B8F8B|nr:serine/threonine-protein kinase [Archangium sp.]